MWPDGIPRRWCAGITGGTLLFLASVLLAGGGYRSDAAPLLQPVADGQSVFQQKCTSCHTIGGGKLAGPDLKGVTARRDRAWLVRFIVSPDKVLAEKDPTATQLLQEYSNIPMPNLGISEADANAILDYLASQGGAPPAATPQPGQAAPPALAGDPAAGKALFTGATGLHNGGAPCISCHSAAGAGQLGGGAVGPDLTQTFTKYGGAAGVGGMLAGLPFPTMKPIYDGRPLTAEEQAALTAFFQASASQQNVDTTLLLTLLIVAGLAVLLLLAQLVWRGRLRSVRGAMVDQSRKTGGAAR